MKARMRTGTGSFWGHEIRGVDEVRRWLVGGAIDAVAIGASETSSRRVQRLWVELGEEDEGSGFTFGAASDVGAGELQYELAGGFFGGRRRIRVEAEEFPGLLEEMFVAVGPQAVMANTDKAAGQDMQ